MIKNFYDYILERNDINTIKELRLLSDMIINEYLIKLENLIKENKQSIVDEEDTSFNILKFQDIEVIFDENNNNCYRPIEKQLCINNDIIDYINRIKNNPNKKDAINILNELKNDNKIIEHTKSTIVHELSHKLDPFNYIKNKKIDKFHNLYNKMNIDNYKHYMNDFDNLYYNLPTEVNSYFQQFCEKYIGKNVSFDVLFDNIRKEVFYKKLDDKNKKRVNKRLYDFYKNNL